MGPTTRSAQEAVPPSPKKQKVTVVSGGPAPVSNPLKSFKAVGTLVLAMKRFQGACLGRVSVSCAAWKEAKRPCQLEIGA